jgi:hypothetical protein
MVAAMVAAFRPDGIALDRPCVLRATTIMLIRATADLSTERDMRLASMRRPIFIAGGRRDGEPDNHIPPDTRLTRGDSNADGRYLHLEAAADKNRRATYIGREHSRSRRDTPPSLRNSSAVELHLEPGPLMPKSDPTAIVKSAIHLVIVTSPKIQFRT